MSSPTTRYRKTHVRLDPPDVGIIEPIMAMERTAFEMARGGEANVTDCWQSPELGWQLEPLQRRASQLHETSALAGSILGVADLQLAHGVVGHATFRQELDLTGVSYSGSAPSQGDTFLRKQVAASESWASRLDADQAAFANATLGAELVPMDRLAVGMTPLPNDRPIFLRFRVPGPTIRAVDRVLTLYFAGPAGIISPTGTGQFALCFTGDGYANLYERQLDTTWSVSKRFAYCAPHQVMQVTHLAMISPSVRTLNPEVAGLIAFEFTLAEGPGGSATRLGAYVPSRQDAKQTTLYAPTSQLVSQPCPIRVDGRRDLAVAFQLSRAAYPLSGTVTDDGFSFNGFPTAGQPITLAWFADVPAGCAVTGRLLDGATGLELVRAGSVAGFPQYTPVFPKRAYVASFQLSGTGTSTPTLYGYRVQRDALAVPSRAVEISAERQAVSVQIYGPSRDPSHESATLELEDLTGALALSRGECGLKIETEYDPLSSVPRTVLFQGAVVHVEAAVKTHDPSWSYPAPSRTGYRLRAIGPWQRLAEAVSPIRFNFARDFNSLDPQGRPLPYLVIDALRILFALAGVGPDSLDLPAVPIRLFATGDHDGLLLEPQAAIGEMILRYVNDYLGYTLFFDPTFGPKGAWRMVAEDAAQAAVAAFLTAGVAAAGPPHAEGRYPLATTFIRKGSLRTWVQPPRGNMVIAYGAANLASGTPVPQLFKQVLVNPLSVDVGPNPTADPTHIDYLGRLRVITQYLPAQASETAVGWVARRLYDRHCHGHRLRAFQAPLLLISDSLTSVVRKLQVTDVVTVNGGRHRLLSVSPMYRSDRHQMAFYESEEL